MAGLKDASTGALRLLQGGSTRISRDQRFIAVLSTAHQAEAPVMLQRENHLTRPERKLL
jgi:hypothetical protein